MNNSEKRLDAYKTLISMAEIFSKETDGPKAPFILSAASVDHRECKVIVCGDEDETVELYRKAMTGIIDELKKTLSAREIARAFARCFSEFTAGSDDTDCLVSSLGLFNFVSLCEETREEYDDEDELSFEAEDFDAEDLRYGYSDEDEDETVIQRTIAEKMSFFEDSLSFGAVEDTDGKVYKLLFSYRSPDKSCVYLRFTDDEAVDGKITLLTAKYFPDIAPSTLFPLTEWENIALSMEYMKESMGFPGETLEEFLERGIFDD